MHVVVRSSDPFLERIGRIDGVITKLRNRLVQESTVRRELGPQQLGPVQQVWKVDGL